MCRALQRTLGDAMKEFKKKKILQSLVLVHCIIVWERWKENWGGVTKKKLGYSSPLRFGLVRRWWYSWDGNQLLLTNILRATPGTQLCLPRQSRESVHIDTRCRCGAWNEEKNITCRLIYRDTFAESNYQRCEKGTWLVNDTRHVSDGHFSVRNMTIGRYIVTARYIYYENTRTLHTYIRLNALGPPCQKAQQTHYNKSLS